MKKERFKEIVSSYSSTPEEVKSLQKLATDYPFSQIVHILLANATKKEDEAKFKSSLVNAALHSTDRSIVKSLIEDNLVPSEVVAKKPAVVTKKQQAPKKAPSKKIAKVAQPDSDALREEVLKNLDLLIRTKKEVAVWFDDDETKGKKSKKKTATKSTSKTTTTKAAARKSTTTAKKKKATPKITGTRNQSKIIDKFIKEEPTISKNNKTVNEKEDLAKESAKMRDDVVSERLAKIFAGQGKTEKAIEIYKKLIWKLPQKKALFAAQIEKLKKK